MGIPLVMVAVLLALVAHSNDGLAPWVSVLLYIVAGFLFLLGFLNLGGTGMAGMGGSSSVTPGEDKDLQE